MQRATHQQIEAECLLSLSANGREKNKKSLEMLSNAVVGVEALWCHLDCFGFHDIELGWSVIGLGLPVCL